MNRPEHHTWLRPGYYWFRTGPDAEWEPVEVNILFGTPEAKRIGVVNPILIKKEHQLKPLFSPSKT